MKKTAALFLLTSVNIAVAMSLNCSNASSSKNAFDETCAFSPSEMFGCFCDVYKEEIAEIYTLAVCHLTPFVENFARNKKEFLADILRLPEVIQSLSDVLIPKHLDLFCPAASNFEACLNTNFTSSQREIDLAVKAFVGSNINRYMVDMCKNRETIKGAVSCMKDLTLPSLGCVGLALVPQISSLNFNSANSGSELYAALQKSICPIIGDLASCLAIQVDAVCSSAFSSYFNYLRISYLTPDCLRLSRQESYNMEHSIFLHCGVVSMSNILRNASSLNYISRNQTDIPVIIRLSTQFVCSDFAKYLNCVTSNIAQSNNVFDTGIRDVLDFSLISQRASEIQTALCRQGTNTDSSSADNGGSNSGSSSGGKGGSDSGSSSGGNDNSDSDSSSGGNAGSDSGSSSGGSAGSDSGSSSGGSAGSDSGSSSGGSGSSDSGSSRSTCGSSFDYATSNEANALKTTIFGLIGVIVVLAIALIAAVVCFIIARKRIERRLAISVLTESENKNPGYEMLDHSKREIQDPNLYDKVQ